MRTFDPVGQSLPVRPVVSQTPEAKAAERERQAFYNNARWRKVSQAFLAANPVCSFGCGRLAALVDHVLPRRTRPDLAYAWSNLRSACVRCHNQHGER